MTCPELSDLVCSRIVVTRLQDAIGGFRSSPFETRHVTSDLRTALTGLRSPAEKASDRETLFAFDFQNPNALPGRQSPDPTALSGLLGILPLLIRRSRANCWKSGAIPTAAGMRMIASQDSNQEGRKTGRQETRS